MADEDTVPTIHATVGADGEIEYGQGTAETLRELVEQLAGERRVVTFSMHGEDLRALLARCLLFTASGKQAPPQLDAVHITIAPSWAVGAAADGYTLGVQKIRCESESGGSFLMPAYDAARILGMIPKPSKDDTLGDVQMDFVAGEGEKLPRLFNLRYEHGSRIITYSCEGMDPATYPDYQALIDYKRPEQFEPYFAMRPEFMELVAKAEIVAKDQAPGIVRWYMLEGGQLAAFFTTAPEHDAFTAFLMPLEVTWEEDRTHEAIAAIMRDLSPDSATLRPATEALPF